MQRIRMIEFENISKQWEVVFYHSFVIKKPLLSSGFLITLSIGAVNYAARKKLSTTVGVMFPIIVFAFCGFDHSVANTLYIFFHGFSWKAVWYLLICVVGNILGGVILPILSLFRTWSNEHKVDKE